MLFEDISKRIADNKLLSYSMFFVIGSALFFIVLGQNEWSLQVLIGSDMFILFSGVSGIVIKFLGGLGLALTYASVSSAFFKMLSPTLRGRKHRTRWARLVITLPVFVIVAYGGYTIYKALMYPQMMVGIELIFAAFGVLSLILMVYLLPLVQDSYSPEMRTGGRIVNTRKRMVNLRHGIWRSYGIHVKRDYGRVEASEYQRHAERLDSIRAILSGILLLPIMLGIIVILPLVAMGVGLWIRVFSLDYQPFSKGERTLIACIMLAVLVFGIVSLTGIGLSPFAAWLGVSYGAGIFLGITLLFIIILTK